MLSVIIPDYNAFEAQETTYVCRRYFPDAQIIRATDLEGRGKGWAIREGLKKAEGDIICFLDADMDISPRMILRLLPFLNDYDMVVGSKGINKGLLQRRIITYLSRIYIRLLFGLRVHTQTGIKLYKREAIPEWKSDGFAFDIEILSKAKKNGFTMIEVPVEATITKGMKWKPILKTLMETLKIRFLL
jgi:glycosyltransferase involved in cell wall biosynthesis